MAPVGDMATRINADSAAIRGQSRNLADDWRPRDRGRTTMISGRPRNLRRIARPVVRSMPGRVQEDLRVTRAALNESREVAMSGIQKLNRSADRPLRSFGAVGHATLDVARTDGGRTGASPL
jgi:hypothetical protein